MYSMTQQIYPAYDGAVQAVRRLTEGKNLGYFVTTLGCQQNEADSEKIRALAVQMGYVPVACPEDAALIVVNTCAIRRHAELRALSILGTYKHIRAKNPDTIIGVCGCMAAQPGVVEKLKRDFHYVSFTLEPNHLSRLPSLVLTALQEGRRSFLFGEEADAPDEDVLPVRSFSHRAYVTIMYGCDNFCSYCIVPYVRGREKSRASASVMKECRALADAGVREITLLGQNVNSYHSDMTFAQLLESIARLPGDFIIRFMTSHPKDVSDELIRVMQQYRGRVAPSFHLPLQSGSDRILRAMNRRYDTRKYLQTVEKLRAALPDIVLTTDIIVAFPGESEEDFEATMSLIRQVRYDMIFSFIYSPREGTRAAEMENPLTEEEKGARMARLLAAQKEISLEKNRMYENRVVRVLADGAAREGGGQYLGRTEGGKLVRLRADTDVTGTFVRVHITKATPYDLFGTCTDAPLS